MSIDPGTGTFGGHWPPGAQPTPNLPLIFADDIEKLRPGSKVSINGVVYIRMADVPERHIEGYLFRPDTGWWGRWTRLTLGSSLVGLVEVPA